MGLLQDLERVKKIVDANTPVNEPNREEKIQDEVDNQKRMLIHIYAYEN